MIEGIFFLLHAYENTVLIAKKKLLRHESERIQKLPHKIINLSLSHFKILNKKK